VTGFERIRRLRSYFWRGCTSPCRGTRAVRSQVASIPSGRKPPWCASPLKHELLTRSKNPPAGLREMGGRPGTAARCTDARRASCLKAACQDLRSGSSSQVRESDPMCPTTGAGAIRGTMVAPQQARRREFNSTVRVGFPRMHSLPADIGRRIRWRSPSMRTRRQPNHARRARFRTNEPRRRRVRSSEVSSDVSSVMTAVRRALRRGAVSGRGAIPETVKRRRIRGPPSKRPRSSRARGRRCALFRRRNRQTSRRGAGPLRFASAFSRNFSNFGPARPREL